MKRHLRIALNLIRSTSNHLKRRKQPHISNTEAQLREIVETIMSTENWLEHTDALSDREYAFIGKFIQIYCIADFNSRRIIDIMREIKTGEKENFASGLTETDVLTHLRRSGEMWTGRKDIGDTLVGVVDLLEMHRQFRHRFAHWVVRKVNEKDIFLILTKSADKPSKRGGIKQDVDKATYAVFMADTLQIEMRKLIEQGRFLANLASYLESNRPSFRDERINNPPHEG